MPILKGDLNMNGKKRKRENLLWKLDLLESSVSGKSRLLSTKQALKKSAYKLSKKKAQEKNSINEDLNYNSINYENEKNSVEIDNKIHILKLELTARKAYHVEKLLSRALKKSCKLEIQKLIRRIRKTKVCIEKEGENDEKLKLKLNMNMKRLEKELYSAKSLDILLWSRVYFHKMVEREENLRLKAENPNYEILKWLPDSIKNTIPSKAYKDSDDYTRNVVSRLFCTKNLVSVATIGLHSLAHAIYNEQFDEMNDGDSNSNDNSNTNNTNTNNNESENENENENECDNYNVYNDMEIGNSEDENDDLILSKSVNLSKDNLEELDSKSLSTSEDSEINEVNENKSENKKTVNESVKKTKRVIPALASGYFSGSEDDEDGFFDNENGIDKKKKEKYKDEVIESLIGPKERKNRRGQRARQKIWELKYGKRANHLKKEEENKKRNEGNRNKYGNKSRYEEGNNVYEYGKENTKDYKNEQAKEQAKVQSDKPLHPSWEARLKQKKTVAFEGKRIKFSS